ncbi:MAG: response regulator transcription factor [Spirochaetaceae bacterium]|nr:response regulator transcription factor [Spirochaetaceae bacterium]
MEKIKVLLVDDQVLFIESLKTVLETLADDITVINIAHNGVEALKIVKKMVPDIILLDVRMPDMDGVETVKILHKKYPKIQIMMLTTFDDDAYVHKALEYGAAGYMLKDVPPQDLINSIRAMNHGTIQMSPQIMVKLMDYGSEAVSDIEPQYAFDKIKKLSKREQELLFLIADNLTNTEIADKIFIAEQTVKNHISSIYSKLGIHDRDTAIKLAKAAKLGERKTG